MLEFTKAVVAASILSAVLGQAQTPAPAPVAPAVFEVATVKLSDPNSKISIRLLPGGRFVASNASLRLLITWAYDIGDERLVGAPRWMESDRYDVVGKAPDENPTLDQFHNMVQSLLAERFKLQVHREHKELPLYILEMDNDGPKVHVLDAGAVISPDPFKMAGLGRLSGTSVTTTMLAKVLSGQLGRYVEDRTGFKSAFDFTLVWRPEGASAADLPADNDARASIFTAIREQLGFRLVSSKAPVEVIAIDNSERHPTEN